jgi:hypothetical protein
MFRVFRNLPRSDGHFLGFRARKNRENMPVIPAWIVRRNLNDPRRIPYLLIWKDEIHGGGIKEAVRLARYDDPHDPHRSNNHVELKRSDGSTELTPSMAISFQHGITVLEGIALAGGLSQILYDS